MNLSALRFRRVGAAVAAAGLLLGGPARAISPPALQGDPFRGRELLSEKLCTQCHSVWSHGGIIAPEMSTAVAGKSWFDLVGDFWNHTPRMIDAMASRGHDWPTIDKGQMADLVSYLYYLRLFDSPGDAARGAIAFSQLRCVTCHSLGGEGGRMGGPLDRFSAYPSSMTLGQAMWNAGPRMQQAQIGRWTAISIFAGSEMADIQAYIRLRAIRADRRVELLPLPDPARGAKVFEAKRCVSCHGGGKSEGPDLTHVAMHRTVSEINGALWNHSYAMNEWMRARGILFPRFEGTEMADLISFLYFLGFVGEEGDPKRGKLIFSERGCASCHEKGDGGAPDLAGGALATDPIALSAAMWNHAPQMHQLMAAHSVAWPKFDTGDMKHLAAYLRKVASPR